ncbi:MAG: hypothetical protein KY475_10080 [Planctomycetes bacterium]|nr:hypothetical protein [Planctomycetota bacterium]
MQQVLSWLLGLPDAASIDAVAAPRLAAPWVADRSGPFWIFLGVAAAVLLAIAFYSLGQRKGSLPARLGLAAFRAVLLALLLVTLAEPVLQLVLTSESSPLLYVLFDGTESMDLRDELTAEAQSRLAAAVPPPSGDEPRSRLEWVQASLRTGEGDNWLARLEQKGYRVEPYLFEGNSTSQLRKLQRTSDRGDELSPDHIAEQLTNTGQVTALGAMLDDAAAQANRNLAGVIVVSDFQHNSGAAPLGLEERRQAAPALRVAAPIHTVGVGALQAIDLAIDLQTNPKMKRAERTTLFVKLRQTGLEGQDVNVRVVGRRLSGGQGSGVRGQESGVTVDEIVVGDKNGRLEGPVQQVEFPYTPEEAGRFEFIAEALPLSGESVEQNNRSSREMNIIDDYLRLMYVAYEPDWEWRFIKEVFHRDKLVGMEGFRTYLASSDPRVRESNVLFLPTLTPARSEFFANDVVFLGDVPGGMLGDRFCEMVKQFVGVFGGGLVVISGPRFGPGELAGSPLEEMLPVLVERGSKLRDSAEFRLTLTPQAELYPFMTLGDDEAENNRAWSLLGRLPWYQPVRGLHEQAETLAAHPSDTVLDGRTPQPLIAIRKYGNGEVVYLAMNETWRLRRMYGEKYYRRFWSQLIHRLGMSHALGAEKRFVVRTDRRQYRAEETATLTVEAFDENFEPLGGDDSPLTSLSATLTLPDGPGGESTRPINVPLLRPGVYEARIPLYAAGEYAVRVEDPITDNASEVRFESTNVSAERRRAIRDAALQEELARATGGRSYDLATVSGLPDNLTAEPIVETLTRNHPLWSTPIWFIALMTLMLGEWWLRKMARLA